MSGGQTACQLHCPAAGAGYMPQFGRGRPKQGASIQERDKMPAGCLLGVDRLTNGDRIGRELHVGPQFVLCRLADAIGQRLLKANNAAGHVPARTVEFVVPPRQQRAPRVVLDQEVHVHQRQQAADQQEDVFRQAAASRGDQRVQCANGVGKLSHRS